MLRTLASIVSTPAAFVAIAVIAAVAATAAIAIIVGTMAYRTEGRPPGTDPFQGETLHGEHMIAQATLAAHYVDAALRAGADPQEINGVLALVADTTVIDEFWVSDQNGRVDFTNVDGTDFAFPTDPEQDTQAAPFAALLTGGKQAIQQDFLPREADGVVFKYAAAAGVDQPRIVQVGIRAQK